MSLAVPGVVMLLEIPLVLGFVVPLLVPLAFLSTGLHTLVFHFSVSSLGIQLKNHARPSTHYLWLSSFLGWALQVWLYYESGLSGWWLVMGGPPFLVCLILSIPWMLKRHARTTTFDSTSISADLGTPLLDLTEAQQTGEEDEPQFLESDGVAATAPTTQMYTLPKPGFVE